MLCGAMERTLWGADQIRARSLPYSIVLTSDRCCTSSSIHPNCSLYQSSRATVFPNVTLCEDVEDRVQCCASFKASTSTAPDGHGYNRAFKFVQGRAPIRRRCPSFHPFHSAFHPSSHLGAFLPWRQSALFTMSSAFRRVTLSNKKKHIGAMIPSSLCPTTTTSL